MSKHVVILTELPGGKAGNAGAWSMKIVADDLARYMPSEVSITEKVHECKGADAVLVLPPEYVPKLMAVKRYMNPFKTACFFGGNVLDFTPAQSLVGPAAWMEKIPFVTHSGHHHDAVKDFVTEWFSLGKQRKMLSNLHLIHGGVPCGTFRSDRKNDRDRWIVPSNRVSQRFKRIDAHSKVMTWTQSLFATKGLKCPKSDFFVASKELDAHWIDKLDMSPYELLDTHPDRSEFIEKLRGYGMFLSTADSESLGMYYMELLASGVVGVFWDQPWVRKLLPEYPFIASTENLPAMMLAVYNDYDRASKYVHDVTIPFLREHRSFEKFAQNLDALLWE